MMALFLDVQLRYIQKISTDIENVQPAPVAIVLGAGISPSGKPSDALRDRLLVGAALYKSGLVEHILVTGDDGGFHADEVRAMRAFLIENGIPPKDIQKDERGYRTYESCKRAAAVFGIRRAIVVTQRFHLGRALYLCNQLGMNATGLTSDLTTYRRIVYFTLRDMVASLFAWWDINVRTPESPVEY